MIMHRTLAFGALLMAAAPATAMAQSKSTQSTSTTGQAMPNSNMATPSPSGNAGAANNGVGNQGSLTGNAGSHSSTVKGAAAAAHIRTHKKPPASQKGAKLEGDPAQGGGQQKQ